MTRLKILNIWIICIFSGSAVFLASTAQAADFEVYPKISVSRKNTQFVDQQGLFDINTDLHTLEVGLTAAMGRFYGSVSYDESINSDASVDQGLELDTHREDSIITLGFRVWKGLHIFAGYKDGRSDITTTLIGSNQVTTLSFRDKGGFGGLSYGLDIGKFGSLAASAAYASMKGNFSSTIENTGLTTDVSGDTTGLSYNAGWNYPVSDDSILSVAFKAHQYQFTSDTLEYDQDFNMVVITMSTRL